MASRANIGDVVVFKSPPRQPHYNAYWTDEFGQWIFPGTVGIVINVEHFDSPDPDLEPDGWYSHTILITSMGVETPGWETNSFEILCSSEDVAEDAHENLVSSRS